jgi:hypothetical protein
MPHVKKTWRLEVSLIQLDNPFPGHVTAAKRQIMVQINHHLLTFSHRYRLHGAHLGEGSMSGDQCCNTVPRTKPKAIDPHKQEAPFSCLPLRNELVRPPRYAPS